MAAGAVDSSRPPCRAGLAQPGARVVTVAHGVYAGLVRVRGRGAAAGPAAAAAPGVHGAGGRRGGGRHPGRQRGRVRRDQVRAAAARRPARPGATCARRCSARTSSLPVIASPVGAQAVHPLGEVAVAMGTRDAGTAMGLSEFASKPAAEVAAVNPKLFFQVHWSAGPGRPARAGRGRPRGAARPR